MMFYSSIPILKSNGSAVPGLRKAIENSNETVKHHFFTVNNAERTFKLGSESDKKMMQFIQSIQSMKNTTVGLRNIDLIVLHLYDKTCNVNGLSMGYDLD